MAKKNEEDFGIKGSKSKRANVRFEVVHGDITHTKKLIHEEIESFIINIERGASMEITRDEYGEWSPLDYFLRTLRPNLDIRGLKPTGPEVLTFLIGAGLDIEKRINVFKFVVEELRSHALEKSKKINKEKPFNILTFMRDCFEEKLVSILKENDGDSPPKKKK
jgi:hypothetical protein